MNAQIWTDRTFSGGLVVTCYAETGVVEGFATHWRLYFKNESGGVAAGMPRPGIMSRITETGQ